MKPAGIVVPVIQSVIGVADVPSNTKEPSGVPSQNAEYEPLAKAWSLTGQSSTQLLAGTYQSGTCSANGLALRAIRATTIPSPSWKATLPFAASSSLVDTLAEKFTFATSRSRPIVIEKSPLEGILGERGIISRPAMINLPLGRSLASLPSLSFTIFSGEKVNPFR